MPKAEATAVRVAADDRIRGIIARFGGLSPMAAKLGHRNHTTVQGWWDRRSIPARRMPEVLSAAARFGITLDLNELIPNGAAASTTAQVEPRDVDSEIGGLARLLASFLGPEFDALPKDRADLRNKVRLGEVDFFDETQDGLIELAAAAITYLDRRRARLA